MQELKPADPRKAIAWGAIGLAVLTTTFIPSLWAWGFGSTLRVALMLLGFAAIAGAAGYYNRGVAARRQPIASTFENVPIEKQTIEGESDFTVTTADVEGEHKQHPNFPP